uniref:SET domain-containing protein n=1 Tax=Tetraselmis chuii TaxID=63592 RepID=A0A7S1SLP8_9CHLO|mmetsp:Transcript_18866/g.33681  ORF Transcript_18866/g.33681 Transcript_18866/m.33681 type:complete len:942 (+) Transcript_18866:249-3074(+)
MRVVYSLDVHGAPIDKLGALQFLVDPQDEEVVGTLDDQLVELRHAGCGAFCTVAKLLSIPDFNVVDGECKHDSSPEATPRSHRKRTTSNSADSDNTSPGALTKDTASSLNSAEEECLNNGVSYASPHDKRPPPEVEMLLPTSKRIRRVSPEGEVTSPGTPGKHVVPPRAASFSAAAPSASASLKDALAHLTAAVVNNTDPCVQGEWHWEATPVRTVVSIDSYRTARDAGEQADVDALATKMATTVTSDRPSAEPLTAEELGSGSVAFFAAPVPLREGADLRVQPCWGMDAYTRRNVFEALALCPGFQHSGQLDSREVASERDLFIERRLLPALQTAGESGWHLGNVLTAMESKAVVAGDDGLASTCHMLASLVSGMASQEKRGARGGSSCRSPLGASCSSAFRVQSRGAGVVCARPGGIRAGTFVAAFCGELCAPWRWYEKQDALRRKHGSLSVADLHSSTALQRPSMGDSLGYDVIFVDASSHANLGARVAHSCAPNCVALTVAAAGELSLGLFTSRDVVEGEELTWDHSHVSELEHEYRGATCLCGTAACRGSALHYVNSKSFQEVLTKRHTFLDRTAMLLAACTDPLNDRDSALLREHGIGAALLGDGEGEGDEWMAKWAALLLRYIEEEHAALPGALMARGGTTESRAAREALSIRNHRMLSLAVTLDKAKYFLRKQPEECREAPLRMLIESEVIEHLWSGGASIARRFVTTASTALHHTSSGASTMAKLKHLLEQAPSTVDACRHLLRNMASTLGALGPAFHAAHDACLLYANTEYFFEPSKYHAISTNLGDVEPASPKGGKPGGKHAGERDSGCKKYRPGFLWGQMSAWYKQTVRDPSASLSADRRGTVSLPDPESCFGKEVSNGRYGAKDRRAMISHIENMPSVMWPLQTIWSFKNPSKIYGSPMLDVAIRRMREEPQCKARFNDLLREFKNTL